jgi:uncharacterized protein (DUF1330 family)
MKARYIVVLSVLAGAAVSAAAVQALHAQATPPAYVVAEIDVANLEPFDKEYVPLAAKAIADGGGKYIVRVPTSWVSPSSCAASSSASRNVLVTLRERRHGHSRPPPLLDATGLAAGPA